MIRRLLVVAVALAAATRVSADILFDIKAALRNLRAKQPVRATYESKSINVAKGRFFDQDTSTSATVEARVDDDGVTIIYPRALLERALVQRNAKRDPKAPKVADVDAPHIAEMLDYAPALIALLDRATVIEDKAHTTIVMNIRQNDDPGVKEGHVDIKLDRLTLTVGPDLVPVSAERTVKFTAGIFFLKAEGQQTEKWTFVRRDDRLIVTRSEHTDSSSGMGQTAHNSKTQTIRIEN
jgi:hypothetical protein